MKKLSIKLKVTLWYTIAMIILSCLVLLTINSVSTEILTRDIKHRIVETVDHLSRELVDRRGYLRPVPDFKLYSQGVHMTIHDSDSTLIKGHNPFNLENYEFSEGKPRILEYNQSRYVVYDKKVNLPDNSIIWIKGMVSVTDVSYSSMAAFKTNILLTVLLILMASVGGYIIIKRAFIPVNKIRSTAKSISESNDLSQRINIGNGRDEISALANTFDDMLNKIEETMEREKQFTSDASHELRTPVAVILSECEYMQDCAKSADELQESGASIKRQAEKMSKLISELLTISRMDRNTLKTNFEKTDISELLTFVCDEQAEIQKKNVSLSTDIDDNITANADKFLLARLFINLISNAYQYSYENSEIFVSLKQDNDKISFTVKDNGIGISNEDLPKIWERFYQADTSRSNRENGNMGLGLSMVKWIAKIHNGEVFAKSELKKGSIFTFIMPKN